MREKGESSRGGHTSTQRETDDQIIARLQKEGLINDSGLVPTRLVPGSAEKKKPAEAGETRAAPVPSPGLGMRNGFAVDQAAIGQTPHLIDGILEQQSAAWLVGPSGSYKTFTATSMAACVATGQEWYGREVLQGPVVYVCAEGGRAWDKRMIAYMQEHPLPAAYSSPQEYPPLYMRPMPIQIGSLEWGDMDTLMNTLKPVLVVIDTQAQCTLEYEENSNTEMAQAVHYLTALAQKSKACVLTVHHSGHGGDGRTLRGRGASAIYAAADTELTMTPKQDDYGSLKVPYVRLAATKQKDMETGHLLDLAPGVVTLEEVADWKGRPVTSVVMREYTPEEPPDDALTARDWAVKLYRAGVTSPAKNREELTRRAKAAGITDLPTGSKSLQPIQTAHKQMVRERKRQDD